MYFENLVAYNILKLLYSNSMKIIFALHIQNSYSQRISTLLYKQTWDFIWLYVRMHLIPINH